MNKNIQTLKYVLLDLISAVIAWVLFFIYRKYSVDPSVLNRMSEITTDTNLYLGITIVPLFWLLLYYLSGNYRKVYRRSRLKELGQTLLVTLVGVTIIFFTLILDDVIVSYQSYYRSFLMLFGLHFTLTYSLRLSLTAITNYRIHHKIIGFNTLLVGSDDNAVNIYRQINKQEKSSGQIFKGFVNVYEHDHYKLEEHLPHLGNYKDLMDIIEKYDIEEVIIAIERS